MKIDVIEPKLQGPERGPSMADRAVIACYQKRAAQIHKLAAHEQNVDLRTSYLTLAKDWMRLADKEAQTDASAAS